MMKASLSSGVDDPLKDLIIQFILFKVSRACRIQVVDAPLLGLG